MTRNAAVHHSMIRRGPYSSATHIHPVMCGFCHEHPPRHEPFCPWPAFRDAILAVWPEWSNDLNEYDQQERLDKEHGA